MAVICEVRVNFHIKTAAYPKKIKRQLKKPVFTLMY